VFGDELVHARIAHEVRRERNPCRRGSFEFSIEKELRSFPRDDLSDIRGRIGHPIAAVLGQPPRSQDAHRYSFRSLGQQLNDISSRFRGDAAQPRRLAWLRPSGRARKHKRHFDWATRGSGLVSPANRSVTPSRAQANEREGERGPRHRPRSPRHPPSRRGRIEPARGAVANPRRAGNCHATVAIDTASPRGVGSAAVRR
jgi:hypothetical protein